MHSNQPVTKPRSKNDVQLTGLEIQAALKDPNSPLSKDLKNAITNAILAKKAHKKAEDRYTDEKTLEHKIEELENELAKERKSSYEKYTAAFEDYYKQIELAVKETQLSSSTSDKTTSSYYTLLHSLAILAQALTVVQNELRELNNEHKLELQNYANNQVACGVAFDKMLNNQYAAGNNIYYFDIDKVPPKEQDEAREAFQKARDIITKPPTQEEMMKVMGPEHPLMVNFALYGPPKKDFLQSALNDSIAMINVTRYSTISGQNHNIGGDKSTMKERSILAEEMLHQIAPQKKKFTIINGRVHQINKKTLSALEIEALIEANSRNTMKRLKEHTVTKSDQKRDRVVNDMCKILPPISEDKLTPTSTMRKSQ